MQWVRLAVRHLDKELPIWRDFIREGGEIEENSADSYREPLRLAPGEMCLSVLPELAGTPLRQCSPIVG